MSGHRHVSNYTVICVFNIHILLGFCWVWAKSSSFLLFTENADSNKIEKRNTKPRDIYTTTIKDGA